MIGPKIMPPMNDIPMVMPITAMMRVRFSSRVKSAANAIVGPATAPKPWIARPNTISHKECAIAAIALPKANTIKPPIITGLRPTLSESTPKGIWKIAWVKP